MNKIKIALILKILSLIIFTLLPFLDKKLVMKITKRNEFILLIDISQSMKNKIRFEKIKDLKKQNFKIITYAFADTFYEINKIENIKNIKFNRKKTFLKKYLQKFDRDKPIILISDGYSNDDIENLSLKQPVYIPRFLIKNPQKDILNLNYPQIVPYNSEFTISFLAKKENIKFMIKDRITKKIIAKGKTKKGKNIIKIKAKWKGIKNLILKTKNDSIKFSIATYEPEIKICIIAEKISPQIKYIKKYLKEIFKEAEITTFLKIKNSWIKIKENQVYKNIKDIKFENFNLKIFTGCKKIYPYDGIYILENPIKMQNFPNQKILKGKFEFENITLSKVIFMEKLPPNSKIYFTFKNLKFPYGYYPLVFQNKQKFFITSPDFWKIASFNPIIYKKILKKITSELLFKNQNKIILPSTIFKTNQKIEIFIKTAPDIDSVKLLVNNDTLKLRKLKENYIATFIPDKEGTFSVKALFFKNNQIHSLTKKINVLKTDEEEQQVGINWYNLRKITLKSGGKIFENLNEIKYKKIETKKISKIPFFVMIIALLTLSYLLPYIKRI